MKSNVLIELDCLLDTRIGTYVSKLGIDINEVLSKGLLWWQRMSEEPERFTDGRVTLDEYKEAYAKRDIDTLKHSFVTNVTDHLMRVSQTMRKEEFRGREIEEVIVTINYYPYQLTEEMIQGYIEAIKHTVSLDTIVRMVSIPPEKAHPRILAETYETYMVYNFEQWLEPFAKTLHNESKIPITVVSPAIWFNRPMPTVEDLTNYLEETTDPFKALITMFLATFELDLIPVGVYSLRHPLGYNKLLDAITMSSEQSH